MNPTTPDGRYFVVKGHLWRCSNPSLDDEERQRLVKALMAARREVKTAKASGDLSQMKRASRMCKWRRR
jgi:recombinational DNA repair protein RecR